MVATGISGTKYSIDGTMVGSGGEGDVYRCFITKMVKLYKPGVVSLELEQKLRVMIEHPPDESVLS